MGEIRPCIDASSGTRSALVPTQCGPVSPTVRKSPHLTSSVAYTIGWLFVISGVLAVLAVSFFPRYGYSITTAGLLLAFAGLLIAGHTWAAVVVFVLTLARYGYYLYLRNKVRLVRSWR